jgi:CHAT domain-containing protein
MEDLDAVIVNLLAGQPDDFEQGVAAYREAVDLFAREHDVFDQARVLNNLAAGYKRRSIRLGGEDLERAAAIYSEALALLPMEDFPEDHRRMAGDLGSIHFRLRQWPEAAKCYQQALEAAQSLYQGSLLLASKESELATTRDLYGPAAYALAREKRSAEATVALERGRSRILSEALARDRADLERLQAAILQQPLEQRVLSFPGPLQTYRDAARKLRHLEAAERASRDRDPGKTSSLPDELTKARAALRQAVNQIRNIAGFEKFLSEPDFDEICRAVAPGIPVVYLVTAAVGSLALLLWRQAGEVTAETVWADTLVSADLEALLASKGGERVSARLVDALPEILPLLGARLIAPVARRLEEVGAEGVVLVPCGALGLIPLHACDYPTKGKSSTLLDCFDVSYIPSARFLLAAREVLAAREGSPPVLAGIANPLPHPSDLRFADMELEQAAGFFAPEARKTLHGTDARLQKVEEIVADASYFHFACHGRFDPAEPLDSSLDLAGGERLTLRQIFERPPFRNLRLAVLSACETARAEHERLPDEVIGLPAGLLSAGAPAVVGSLWLVNDVSAALLMRKFYELHRVGDLQRGLPPMPPARALRFAQLWLRNATSGELFYFFNSHRRPEDVSSHPMLSRVAASGAASFGLHEPDHRPYALSPYHWAPFVYVGA